MKPRKSRAGQGVIPKRMKRGQRLLEIVAAAHGLDVAAVVGRGQRWPRGVHAARVMFAVRARDEIGLGPVLIGRLLCRDKSTVKYYQEPEFREYKREYRRVWRERKERGSQLGGDQGAAV